MTTSHKPASFKIMSSCTIGTFLEFFDYTLYGYFISTIGHLFFPNQSPALQLLASWGIFALGFLVRPLGAMYFGHQADRQGRRKILPFITLLMAFPTVCIGLLPTYDMIGWFAPVLLLACRVTQGIAISAEYNAASIIIIESQWKRPGFLASFTPFSCGMGMLAASLLAYIFTNHQHELSQWQWRLPFIIAGTFIGLFAFLLRCNLKETESFIELQKSNAILDAPLLQTVKKSKLAFATSIICSAYMVSTSYLLLVYISTFLQQQFQMTLSTALLLAGGAVSLESMLCLAFGWMSDYIARWRMLLFSTLAMIIAAMSMYLQPTYTLNQFLIHLLFLIIILAAFDGPLSLYLPRLFSTNVRYSATSVSYNIGGPAIGGLAPFIVTLILYYLDSPQQVLSAYLIVWASLATIFILLHAKRKKQKVLPEIEDIPLSFNFAKKTQFSKLLE